MMTDVLGRPLEVGQLIGYGVARANISLAVIHEIIDTPEKQLIKIAWPTTKVDQMKTPPYTVHRSWWDTKRSSLTTSASIAVLDINHFVVANAADEQLVKIYREINARRIQT